MSTACLRRSTTLEDLYEGQNTIWADFGNGVVAGMYDDMNYGDLNDEIDYYHGPYYHFPQKFYDLVIKLLKDNQ